MKRPLKVGDICIGQHFMLDTEYNGRECTIVKDLSFIVGHNKNGYDCSGIKFVVVWESGEKTPVRPHNLKLKPPKDDSMSWAKEKVKDLLKLTTKENDLVTTS